AATVAIANRRSDRLLGVAACQVAAPGADDLCWCLGLTARPLGRRVTGRAGLSLPRCLFVPPEDAHGPERVPPARLAFAVIDREIQLAGMRVLQRPAPVRVTLGPDQPDRLGRPVVGGGAGRAQVVEAAEHVVVPERRVGELRPRSRAAGLAVLLDRLAGRQP